MTAMRTMLVSVVLLCTSPALLSAGVTGKITGQVTDTHGNPLPGASVVIQGTRHGDVAEYDGVFFIIAVEPGDGYVLECSMIGYETWEKREVNVSSDFTTNVSFELKEKSILLDGIVVSADALYEKFGGPPVEPDKTTSHYVVTRKELERRGAVRTVEELLTTLPGVDLTNAAVIRGSDPGDAAVYVDGIRLPTNDAYGNQFLSINRTAVQEITVITGGANAEYGNLEAGAVSVVTREGADRYQVWTDARYTLPGKKHWGENLYDSAIHRGKMRWGDPEWLAETVILDNGPDGVEGTPDDEIGLAHRRLNYTDGKGIYLEGGVAGPIGSQMGFFSGARWTRQAQDITNEMSVKTRVVPDYFNEQAEGFPSLHTPLDLQGNLKLSLKPTTGLKLSAGGVWSVKEGYNRGHYTQRNLEDHGRNVFLPDGSGAGGFRLTDKLAYLTLTHVLNARTFYELRLGSYSTVQDTQDVRHSRNAFGFLVPTPAQQDADGWFNVKPARQVDFTLAERSRLQVRANLSSQVRDGHFLKTGVDLTYYGLYYYRYQDPPPPGQSGQRWVTFVNAPGHMPDEREPVHPMEMAAYLQDKMEFEGMVINAGLRLDAVYSNQRHHSLWHMAAPQGSWLIKRGEIPTIIDPRWISMFSPRLGISHPMGDRAAIHFSAGLYGRINELLIYSQEWWQAATPDTHQAWDGFRGSRAMKLGGDPDVDFTRTRAYEAGADWNFTSDYIAGISAYYHSQLGKPIGAQFVWYAPGNNGNVVGVTMPKGYADMKGLEVNFRKGLSHHFSFNAALNFGWATNAQNGSYRVNVYVDSAFVMNPDLFHDWKWDQTGGQYVRSEPLIWKQDEDTEEWARVEVTTEDERRALAQEAKERQLGAYGAWVRQWGREDGIAIHIDAQEAYDAPVGTTAILWQGWGTPSIRHDKGHDRRAQLSLSLYFEGPLGFGPRLGSWHPLGDLRANMVYRMYTGHPSDFILGMNEAPATRHDPVRTWVDLSVEKTLVQSGDRNAVVYVEVYNLFNQKDSVLPGGLDDYVRCGMDVPRPDDADYQAYGDYDELTRYGGRPREFSVGLKLSF